METNFKKVHTSKDLIISSIVLIAGVGFFFVNKGLGILLAVCGLGMLFVYKGGYMKDGKGAVLHKRSEDLCKSCRSSMLDYLNGKDITPELKKGNDGGSVRLDVYFSCSENVAYAQLFDFRNYSYEPLTDVVELHSPKVEKLISQL